MILPLLNLQHVCLYEGGISVGIGKIKHWHVSDRWRHGCRRRAHRDVLAACHWNDGA